jgi:hypothetical protein
MFSNTILNKLSDPRDRPNIDPIGMINTSFVEVNKAMSHVKYLSSKQYSFIKYLSVISYTNYIKLVKFGSGPILPQGA